MSSEQAGDLGKVRARTQETVEAMEAQASEVLELARRIETLTGGTSDSYAGMRTRVEARETLRQVLLLAGTLKKLDEGSRANTSRVLEDPFQDR